MPGLSLKAVEARDDTVDWDESRCDLILLSYAGCSVENVPRNERALKSGGLLVVEPDLVKKKSTLTGEHPRVGT